MRGLLRCAWLSLITVLVLAACAFPDPSGTPSAPPNDHSAIQVFFTSPPSGEGSDGLAESIVQSIQDAREYIDVAMYNFSLETAASELIAASNRGVQVRVVIDSDALDSRAVQRLQGAGVQVVSDRRESLMHHKFLIVDGQVVWTGSMNLTRNGLYDDNNVMARFESMELAALFTQEFDEMFLLDQFSGGAATLAGEANVQIGGAEVEVLFSPDDRPSARILELVGSARERIDVLAYILTQNELRDALLAAHRSGVQVRGVFDEEQFDSTGHDYESLKQAGLDVRFDGIPGLMHEKVIIVDGQTVIFGSYNFTRSADERNDENVLVLRDAQLADLFSQEFQRIYEIAR